jgi:hypothetical protein
MPQTGARNLSYITPGSRKIFLGGVADVGVHHWADLG